MRDTTIILPVVELDNLQEPPHVLTQLTELFMGNGPMTPPLYEDMWTHIAMCIHCQTLLGSYLVAIIEYNKIHNVPTGDAEKLLAQLKDNIHQILKEDIPAYLDALSEQGEEKANKHFPLLAEHILSCEDCNAEIEDLRLWLRQLVETL